MGQQAPLEGQLVGQWWELAGAVEVVRAVLVEEVAVVVEVS